MLTGDGPGYSKLFFLVDCTQKACGVWYRSSARKPCLLLRREGTAATIVLLTILIVAGASLVFCLFAWIASHSRAVHAVHFF